MAEIQTKKVKKKKIKVTGLIFIIIVIAIIYFIINCILNLPIKHIYITGTNIITDNEIINKCAIKDYPSIYKLSLKKMKNDILEIPLVKDVSIKRNIFGKLTINITEDKALFLNRSTNKIVLQDGKEIDNTYNFYRLPILINLVPDTIYKELITGLNRIDYDIVSSISEIEYSPSNNEKGETIDDTRFYLRMNDGNAIYMNTVNIKRLNSYNTIYASIFASVNGEKGTFYLDSITEENIYFKSFASLKQEQIDLESSDKDELREENGGNNN